VGVDYDRWLGQVPWRTFNPARFNGWMNFFDTSDGIITDMGCHYTDQMQWVLGTDDTGPVEFEGKAEWPDPAKFMSEVPLSCEARARYANGITGVMYQRKGFADRYIKYIGDEGWIQVDDNSDLVTAEPRSILNLRNTAARGWGDITGHFADLLHCMRNRTPPICHPEVGHRAQTVCLAMTIAMRLERKLKWDPQTERFDDESANRLLWREPRAPWRL
jgi:predicted dehydrogenase